MASDVLCLCIMIAAADLFLGFATSFQQVYALAQCDVYCSNYVTQAVQRIAVECGGAPSGQVYLDKCYITYSYYPHGGGLGGTSPSSLLRKFVPTIPAP